MRYGLTTIAACLLAACTGIPASLSRSCSSPSECQVQAYSKACG